MALYYEKMKVHAAAIFNQGAHVQPNSIHVAFTNQQHNDSEDYE